MPKAPEADGKGSLERRGLLWPFLRASSRAGDPKGCTLLQPESALFRSHSQYSRVQVRVNSMLGGKQKQGPTEGNMPLELSLLVTSRGHIQSRCLRRGCPPAQLP